MSPEAGQGARLWRALVDVVLIVGSILLAFAIDAGWQARQERTRARVLMTSLEGEFEVIRAELVRHRDRWEEAERATERLLVANATGDVPPPAVMDTLLFRFLTPTTFDAEERALADASASGGLALIEDEELRRLLTGWPGVVAEARDNEIAGREFILRVITPYLAEAEIPLGRSRALLATAQGGASDSATSAPDRWRVPLPDDATIARAYARLMGDPSFEPLLVTRYQWINVGEFDEAIAFVDDILRHLDTALR